MLTAADILNHSGLLDTLSRFQQAAVLNATRYLLEPADNPDPTDTPESRAANLLLHAGPAAAMSAMNHAVTQCRARGQLTNITFTGNLRQDVQIIANRATPTENADWFAAAQMFLMPRSSWINFDNMVDPRHQVDLECGYPKYITPWMYRYLYDRDNVAKRIVDLYTDEAFIVDPIVYEDDNEETLTDFEARYLELADEYQLLQYLYRLSKLAGVGHYAVLLVGLDDGKELWEPVDEPELIAGKRKTIARKKRDIIYLRPFDEYLSFVSEFETNENHPRFGMPNYYSLVFVDMTIDAAGAAVGTRLMKRVHWSRVVHSCPEQSTSHVFGVPRCQPVVNRILDIRKTLGAAGEGYWKSGFPGISFEVDPRIVADQPEFDADKFNEEIQHYLDGQQKVLRLIGVKANILSPNVTSPREFVKTQLEMIASTKGIPMRILMGSEEGKLSSSTDKLNWNQRLRRFIKTELEPSVIRNTLDRFIALGVMPPPKRTTSGKWRYYTDWSDLNTATDNDKANLALKWTQALSQYVASGVVHLVPPLDFLTLVLGLSPKDAIRTLKHAQDGGGFNKLLKVSPAQGSGRNGVRTNDVGKPGSQNGPQQRGSNPPQ